MSVVTQLDRQLQSANLFAHAPVAWFQHDDALRMQSARLALQLRMQAAAIGLVVERRIFDAAARSALLIAEMNSLVVFMDSGSLEESLSQLLGGTNWREWNLAVGCVSVAAR